MGEYGVGHEPVTLLVVMVRQAERKQPQRIGMPRKNGAQVDDWQANVFGDVQHRVAIRIRSRDEEAVFSGDLMHWPMQCIYPDWRFRADADPDLARRTRWAFLESCAENRHLVITSHFPLPSLGTILRRQSSFWFEDHPS